MVSSVLVLVCTDGMLYNVLPAGIDVIAFAFAIAILARLGRMRSRYHRSWVSLVT